MAILHPLSYGRLYNPHGYARLFSAVQFQYIPYPEPAIGTGGKHPLCIYLNTDKRICFSMYQGIDYNRLRFLWHELFYPELSILHQSHNLDAVENKYGDG
ncbi:MAG: hypothetical protein P8Y99_15805 [Calditrichaceae bacterium]